MSLRCLSHIHCQQWRLLRHKTAQFHWRRLSHCTRCRDCESRDVTRTHWWLIAAVFSRCLIARWFDVSPKVETDAATWIYGRVNVVRAQYLKKTHFNICRVWLPQTGRHKATIITCHIIMYHVSLYPCTYMICYDRYNGLSIFFQYPASLLGAVLLYDFIWSVYVNLANFIKFC